MARHGNTGGLALERFEDDGTFPNSRYPLLFYRAALPREEASAEAMEQLFSAGGWPPAWRSSVFTYHHYHSTAHEVLGIARGTARLMLGGPHGREFDVAPGDVIVIPAGVVHRRLSSSPDFLVVGGYPPGQSWDLLRGEASERPRADRNIALVPLPKTDPVAGENGPLIEHWR
ncbi:MAG TPA: cupin domain-containing protein [Alphaproteobacteria bacterium]|nr:cupin domain-containing protein [Alphaproteobacteria bacterium]